MKTAEELLATFDDDTLRTVLVINRIQIYKLRKGIDLLTLKQIERLRDHDEVINAPPPADPNNPDYTHPKFVEYDIWWKQMVAERGFEDTYLSWTAGSACGCMGPQDGAPFCSCRMRALTARRYGKIVQTDA